MRRRCAPTTLDDKAFTYDPSGRMATVSLGGQLAMMYQYNAWGEQVVRQHQGVATVALHDEAGHWIGDYAADGKAIRQAIWLDDFPIALIENGTLYDIETDHLRTPRAVVDRASDTETIPVLGPESMVWTHQRAQSRMRPFLAICFIQGRLPGLSSTEMEWYL